MVMSQELSIMNLAEDYEKVLAMGHSPRPRHVTKPERPTLRHEPGT
jgi:hypothetical protein